MTGFRSQFMEAGRSPKANIFAISDQVGYVAAAGVAPAAAFQFFNVNAFQGKYKGKTFIGAALLAYAWDAVAAFPTPEVTEWVYGCQLDFSIGGQLIVEAERAECLRPTNTSEVFVPIPPVKGDNIVMTWTPVAIASAAGGVQNANPFPIFLGATEIRIQAVIYYSWNV